VSSEAAFAFRAVRRDGGMETGVIVAPSREAAAALIGSRGSFAVELSVQSPSRRVRRAISPEDLAAGLRALATLLDSGIPVARALAILDDLAPPAWLATLPEVRRRVEQGERLGQAFVASALPLPPHVIGMIGAGEAGGGLAPAVERAAQLLEARAAARAELRNALAYPIVLAVAGSASVALLVGVVLPRFAGLLADSGQALPVTTRLVLALGAAAYGAVIPGVCAAVAGAALWHRWIGRAEGLRRWHTLLLAAPVIGPIRRARATANACSALSALLDAGVPLAAALPHAARASGDCAQESRLLAARQRIALGAAMSSALSAEDALTPAAVRLVRLGEETGRLSQVVAQAGALEAIRTVQRVQRAIRVIEPAMILLFGGVVMLVAAALLQAMYGLRVEG
jgi:general secretion pathway protein F